MGQQFSREGFCCVLVWKEVKILGHIFALFKYETHVVNTVLHILISFIFFPEGGSPYKKSTLLSCIPNTTV